MSEHIIVMLICDQNYEKLNFIHFNLRTISTGNKVCKKDTYTNIRMIVITYAQADETVNSLLSNMLEIRVVICLMDCSSPLPHSAEVKVKSAAGKKQSYYV